MVKKTSKTVFCCQACGYQTPKWMGKCPDCGEWQTFVEDLKHSLSQLIPLNLSKKIVY